MKLYMFRAVPLSIIRSFSLYTHQWYMSYRFDESKFVSAKQAKEIYQYKNTKGKIVQNQRSNMVWQNMQRKTAKAQLYIHQLNGNAVSKPVW